MEAKCNSKTTKEVHAEGLVRIWFMIKHVPSLVDGSGLNIETLGVPIVRVFDYLEFLITMS